ncbi:MAG: hypothetical protein ATN32_00565 [Candidatus Epulonipiscium fishelsonii]|nr:MAG: hypothetical protein ATN32_00565 [Epulopiscium sp. AS2M-Bin002]
MFIKYLKRELYLTLRKNVFIILIPIILSLLILFISLFKIHQISNALILIYICSIVVNIIFLIMIIINSIKERLFDEYAYLTFSLPIKTNQIILAKVINAIVMFLLIFIVFSISFNIVALRSNVLDSKVIDFLKEYLTINSFLFFIELLINVPTIIVMFIFALSVVNIFKMKYKVFYGIVIFLGIDIFRGSIIEFLDFNARLALNNSKLGVTETDFLLGGLNISNVIINLVFFIVLWIITYKLIDEKLDI